MLKNGIKLKLKRIDKDNDLGSLIKEWNKVRSRCPNFLEWLDIYWGENKISTKESLASKEDCFTICQVE